MGSRIKDDEEDLEKGNEAQTVRNAPGTHMNWHRRGLGVLCTTRLWVLPS